MKTSLLAQLSLTLALVLTSTAAQADRRAARDGDPAATGGDRPPGERQERSPPEHLRFGPLLGLAFPRPLAIEGFAKIERLVGVGLEYGLLPRTAVQGVDFGFQAFSLDLRVFPFRGAFFIGARVGRQWLDARTTLRVPRFGPITETMEAATWFVNPRAGFLYTFSSGLTLGVDAGIQLPIAPTYERHGPATSAGLTSGLDVEGTLVAVANALGNSPTPTIDLLRVGFLF